MKNRSQLRDLDLTPEESWNRRMGRNTSNPRGIESTLGHAYSTILEYAAKEGIDVEPDFDGFLGYIRDTLYSQWKKDAVTPHSPCYMPHTDPIKDYMKKLGMVSIAEVIYELIGRYQLPSSPSSNPNL